MKDDASSSTGESSRSAEPTQDASSPSAETSTAAAWPDVRSAVDDESPGSVIGRYRLLERIGEGGFGVVYVAEQKEPIRRRVALKIIKLGMDTRQVVARFEAERQALAMMDHPNIAKVLDAGATQTGRPFFVMELVRGVPITTYCDSTRSRINDRLALFIQVCNAIQHAHQKGIIHRDIKPSNILVTLHDGVPVPKVIDFGIAKATQGELTDKTVYTQFQQFIGTPLYMSPEQAEMSGLDLDTRCDIYSLGVLLYELLTGQTPFSATDLAKLGIDEVRKTIREKEAIRPSARLTRLSEQELTSAAHRLGAERARLIGMLRGDLDWIVMKCLEKDRTRRYETANGLAMEVRRYLSGEPVVARPASRVYLARKLIRRNKLAFAAASMVLVAMLLGLTMATAGLVQARREARRADQQASNALRVVQSLQGMLNTANPDNGHGLNYTVRQLLDDFAPTVPTKFAGQPEAEATLQVTIGDAYRNLGLHDQALQHLQRGLELRKNLFGPDSEIYAQTLVTYAWALHSQQRLAESEAVARQAIQICQSRGIGGASLISALQVLQTNLLNESKFDELVSMSDRALGEVERAPDADPLVIAGLYQNLSIAKTITGQYSEAERLARRALEIHLRVSGPDAPQTAWAYLGLSASVISQHRFAEAADANEHFLSIFHKAYPLKRFVDLLPACVHFCQDIGAAEPGLAGVEQCNRQMSTLLDEIAQIPDLNANDTFTVAIAYQRLRNASAARRSYAQAIQRMNQVGTTDAQVLQAQSEAQRELGIH